MDHLRLPKDDKDGGPPENCSQCYKSAGQIYTVKSDRCVPPEEKCAPLEA